MQLARDGKIIEADGSGVEGENTVLPAPICLYAYLLGCQRLFQLGDVDCE